MKEKTRKLREAEQQRIQQQMQQRINDAHARAFQREAAETKAQDGTTNVDDVQPETVRTVEKTCIECQQTFTCPALGSHIRKLCDTCKSNPDIMRRRSTEAKQRQRQRDSAATAKSKAEFWAQQRALLPPERLVELENLDAYVRTLMRYVRYKQQHPEIPQDVLNHVFAKLDEDSTDVEAEVRDFVKANPPGPHLGYIHRDRSFSIPNDWMEREFWKDPALMAKLEAENEATKIYVRLGLLVSLPDWIIATSEPQVVDSETRWLRYE